VTMFTCRVRTLSAELLVVAAIWLTSCTDKSVDGVAPYDRLMGAWPARSIEGALDSSGNPLDSVSGSMSTLTFRDDKTYTWFLNAPPYHDLKGEGHYIASEYDNFIYVDGAIPEYLGTSIIRVTNTGDTLTLVDDEYDHWTYIR
jgi:hypothetical protein